ncbi:MAG: GNAT family N-acetyltransferase [Allomuricauda sp.]|nr:MAG: GNAT family N-acetyltransferase [Allomuricauda sp.]
MIRHAKISEIAHILLITKACTKAMEDQGIYQWNEHYPSLEAFQEDHARKELYVLTLNEDIIGSITISTLMDEEYQTVDWLTPNSNHIYIHRLCVHPNYQGRGYAQQLMDFAESWAQKNSCASVRLDTFSQNNRNQKFYEARGYKKLGNVHFPEQSQHPFYCYELVL